MPNISAKTIEISYNIPPTLKVKQTSFRKESQPHKKDLLASDRRNAIIYHGLTMSSSQYLHAGVR